MIGYFHDTNEDTTLGKHFMASLLWNTAPEKMWVALQVVIAQSEKYGVPIDYESLGIAEV